MSVTTTLYQSRENLSVCDYIKYTAFLVNDSGSKQEDLTLTATAPYGLALERNSIQVSDNADTLRCYPYVFDKGVLTVDLPLIPADENLMVTFVYRKTCVDPCLDTYTETVTVADVDSNTVTAQNRCYRIKNAYYH